VGITDTAGSGLVLPDATDTHDRDETPRQRVDRMQRDNDATLRALAQRGAQVPQAVIDTVRLGLLTEHLLGDLDDPRRQDYELAVQTRFAELLADLQGQVTRAVLTAGVGAAAPPPPPGRG
jgi:hypothetical protein